MSLSVNRTEKKLDKIVQFEEVAKSKYVLVLDAIKKVQDPIIRNKLLGMHREIIKGPVRGIWMILAGTIFGPVLGVSLALQTVSMLDSGVAQTIFSLVPVMAIPLAWWFYQEKISWMIVLSATLALAGVMVMIWHEQIAILLRIGIKL
jgi:drug/metabolite transporter (DMT)-like permease